MSNNFQDAINLIRKKANNETEKGNAFEKLSKIYFENDDVQKQFYKKVWHYKDWASQNLSYSKIDIGIDLVAELKQGGLAAIQCKCYESNHTISKEDLDSFISASSSEIFRRLILIDTSNNDLGPNAKSVIQNLDKEYLRIQKIDLEASRIQWLTYLKEDKIIFENKKKLRDHQVKALNAAEKYFKENNRGKMIMACGTGKTFTSLKIAEKLTGKGKFILYMVPSLALMSQTIREWKNDCSNDFEAFSACSDKKVGKKKSDDEIIVNLNDLSFPATTDSKKLADEIKRTDQSKLIVIFSTYQSIDVVTKAQKEYGLRKFDLILCDEAHRTTGATLTGDDESYFVKIHNNDYISGKKRLYMTATPRIYGEKAKQKAEEGEAELASMDDKEKFGETFFTFGFNDAVENDLLTDYKVVILAIDEEKVSETLQKSFEEGSELKLDEATKIIGCYKALAKVGFEQNKLNKKKLNPIKRALAFTQSINISKIIQSEFKNVVDDYLSNEKIEEKFKVDLDIEIEHVDGTFPSDKRNEKLNWLKDDTEKNHCRILSNVRCLSEGVDVPTLDAIMFLHPRKSQIDVVQSVGRVMRKAESKDMGYVIIPITVAPGVSPERALNDSERYRVVWQILNALRSHDERMDSAINKIGLGEDVSDKIEIIGGDTETQDITSVVDDIKPKSKNKKKDDQETIIGKDDSEEKDDKQDEWIFEIGDLSKAIKAKIVEKCGTRDYWENWAIDIAKIAQTHITRLNSILVKKNSSKRKVFDKFLEEIRDDLNPEISEADAVEMLAQHIITKPVFDTLFQGNEFTKDNPISKAIENILEKIYETNIKTENETLEKFYASVRRKAKDIISSTSRTALLNQLYERFFKNAFPKTTDKLGIVYTPIEVVDFINNSIEQILKKEFRKSLNNENVHVLDPFTGTGTFIVRLIESGILKKETLLKKYTQELHANEIVLLAYYMACINIESAFHEILKPNKYTKFDGGVLTDTFQLYEQERDMIANLLPDNSKKRTKQKKRDIRVIIGNPPYSAGQTTANDETKNLIYPNLDEKIKSTYVKNSSATLKHDLYDSYIRAFRWASDRIGDEGIIGFVTNAGWVDGNATDGFRKIISKEFNKIYTIHLRGNQRTSGELSRKEGGKIFGSGSRSPIAITFLVKKKKKLEETEIFFYDIGDYLKREEKLKIIKNFNNIYEIENKNKFLKINPDNRNDWINKSNPDFEKFTPLGSKKNEKNIIFKNYSLGVATNKDSWCYNFSENLLKKNIEKFINFYNSEVHRTKSLSKDKIEKNISYDKLKIAWSSKIINSIKNKQLIKIDFNKISKASYRPFLDKFSYLDQNIVERRSQMDKIFPNNTLKNITICITGIGAKNGFNVLAANKVVDLNFLEGGTQCFPMYLYNNLDLNEGLFQQNTKKNDYQKENSISDYFHQKFKKELNKNITKEEIFFYIFGVLNSEKYIQKYQNNLNKELPRVPIVKSFDDYEELYKHGKKLAEIQISENEKNLYPLKNEKKIKEKFKKLKQIDNFKIREDKKNKVFSITINNTIKIEDIDIDCLKFTNKGKSIIDHYLSYAKFSENKDSKISDNIINFENSLYIYKKIKNILYISLKTFQIRKILSKINI